jgi:DNA-binding NarL/FixJ family response regulator
MRFFVDHCPRLSVVGLAADVNEAADQIRAENADVALVEIQMPLEDGLTTIAALREQFPELRILVCSFLHDPATRDAAREHGADGYLAKPPHVVDLLGLVAGPPQNWPDAVAPHP